MEKIRIKGKWNEIKGKLKKKFAAITDNDLMYETGKGDEMPGKSRKKIGKTNDEWDKIMSEL